MTHTPVEPARPSWPAWWYRLERRRDARGDTLKEVGSRIAVTSQTLYNWRDRGRPDNADGVRGLAEYLQEDFDSLLREIRREPTAVDVLRGYATWDLSTANTELARVLLGHLLEGQEPGEVMLDVVLRLVRRRFPAATVGFQAQWRGIRQRAPFQYAVHVEDRSKSPEDVSVQVREVFREARMPVSIEHSKGLLPEQWRDYPVVLVPIHLAPREAQLSRPSSMGGLIALMLGVWYSGAPDVMAKAAGLTGAGAASITNLAARLSTGWDVRSKRMDSDLEALQVRLADRIASELSPVPGPFIWSINDVPPVLDPDVQDRLRRNFRGRLIVLQLDEDLLHYAAYRSHTASGVPIAQELERLQDWQHELSKVAIERSRILDENGEAPAVAHVLLHKPPGIMAQPVDGQQTWPDAVDEMFDLYCEVGAGIAEWLARDTVGLTTFDTVIENDGWVLAAVDERV